MPSRWASCSLIAALAIRFGRIWPQGSRKGSVRMDSVMISSTLGRSRVRENSGVRGRRGIGGLPAERLIAVQPGLENGAEAHQVDRVAIGSGERELVEVYPSRFDRMLAGGESDDPWQGEPERAGHVAVRPPEDRRCVGERFTEKFRAWLRRSCPRRLAVAAIVSPSPLHSISPSFLG